MTLVLVTVSKTDKHIFNVKHVSRVVVTVESQRTIARVSQCFRYQRFGLGQSRCTVMLKCVKCAGDHHYTECNKSNRDPPKCANCGESHTASYRGCGNWPQVKKQTTSKLVSDGECYAKTVTPNTCPTPNTMSSPNFSHPFKQQMQDSAKKLSETFTATKPSQ